MKTGAMIRIIIWAVIALLLVGVLLYFLMGGSWPFGAKRAGFGSSAHTEEPAAAERPQLEQIDFSDVSKLEIHWISGGVTVESTDGEGSFSEDNMKIVSDMGYKTIFWSFAYADWDNDKQPAPESSLQKLLDHTHNGEILLLHPTSATNAAILDRYLTELEKQGYKYGSIEELCGI